MSFTITTSNNSFCVFLQLLRFRHPSLYSSKRSFLNSFHEVLGLSAWKDETERKLNSFLIIILYPTLITSNSVFLKKLQNKGWRQYFVNEGITCWKAGNILPFLVSSVILLASLTPRDLWININKRFIRKSVL